MHVLHDVDTWNLKKIDLPNLRVEGYLSEAGESQGKTLITTKLQIDGSKNLWCVITQ